MSKNKKETGKNKDIKLLGENKKARFNFFIHERLECGIALEGTEVKSLKEGRFNFSDSYCRIKNGELFLMGFHISQYPLGTMFNHEPERSRKLLAHRAEIKKLRKKVEEKGFTLVPLRCYIKKGLIKIEIGIASGKKMHDKRESIKRKDLNREAQRDFKQNF